MAKLRKMEIFGLHDGRMVDSEALPRAPKSGSNADQNSLITRKGW